MVLARLLAGACLVAILVAVVSAGAAPVDPARLPLGDGKLATKPQAGKVFPCRRAFLEPPASERPRPWIRGDGTWDSTAKVAVAGNVAWPKATFSSRVVKGRRRIASKALPRGHRSGVFPVAASDPARQYSANNNEITSTAVSLSLRATPRKLRRAVCLPGGPVGVFRDGVLLFRPLDPYGRDAVAHEVLDRCGGHPDGAGLYHRHAVPSCVLSSATARSTLVGYAFDGFGIYVERDAGGRLLTNAALDNCHGRTSRIRWNGKTVRMYHYVATAEYPYTLGCLRAKPVVSDVVVGGTGSGGASAP